MKKFAGAIGLAWMNTGLLLGQPTLQQPLMVPLLDDDVSFRVPVRMFGRTNYFTVDTGTSVTALDVRFRNLLGESIRRWDQHDLYPSPNIALGRHALGLAEVLCADLCMFRLITGESCDGILGMDFLKNHVVRLDFDEGVALIGGSVPAQLKTAARKIPLTLSNQRHFTIPAVLNDTVTLNVVIDSADSSIISLNRTDWAKVFPSENTAPSYRALLAGIGRQATESRVARLRNLQIGGCTYSNVLCSLSIFPEFSSGIGVSFLRRHLAAFDFPNQMLYLRPGKQFQTEDEHDMSGLHLLRRDATTFVHSVDAGSPAMSAGIQAGDSVVSLNGTNCAAMKMKNIRQALKTKAGSTIVLEIQRDRNVVRAEFVLKRFL